MTLLQYVFVALLSGVSAAAGAIYARDRKVAVTSTKSPEFDDMLERHLGPVVRCGLLMRMVDETGVSGTGHVADVHLHRSGVYTVWWRGDHASVTFWDNEADLIAVHGHRGKTKLLWRQPHLDLGTRVEDKE